MHRHEHHSYHNNCHLKGSRLATVTTVDELNLLIAYARSKGEKTGIWLDGNDIKNEGKWNWSNNNASIHPTYWHHGEPNGKRTENCLIISGSGNSWKWFDDSCKRSHYYACQKNMQNSSEKQCLCLQNLLDELISCKHYCKQPR
ncbi:hypothetical protein KUTeg_002759 [Tegillarca granosa]|uniref:C-type lectin domain-containing protein n=1 Tax=Tegillarca granosa TaxID=220873 RepID=A0ABQ9FR03_TEGGR|nr:hypothetical protein KUTeg_002759 [Tegillarca granosa]